MPDTHTAAPSAPEATLEEVLALPQMQTAPIDDFIPFALNAREHPPEQVEEIAASIAHFGWVWPILRRGDQIIGAGHGRREAAKLLYSRGIAIRMWNGFELPPGHLPFYDASSMSEAKFKAFILVDNRSAEKATWNLPMLRASLDELGDLGVDLAPLGFALPDLADIFGEPGGEGGGDQLSENYSRKIEAPIYHITGEKPAVGELLDDAKTKELRAEIEAADLPDDVRAFLEAAADRHTVFNFTKIAEFYAHADEPTQALMERSALVIIDFNQAIENGFVRLAEGMMEQAEQSKAARQDA